jgi:hypothetical protein
LWCAVGKGDLEIEQVLNRMFTRFRFFQFAVADFGLPEGQEVHDLMLLAVGHLEPVQALFPTAQTAFAITFGIGFADTYTGTGDGEKIGLFHILKAFEIRDRTNQNFRLLSLSSKHGKCIR